MIRSKLTIVLLWTPVFYYHITLHKENMIPAQIFYLYELFNALNNVLVVFDGSNGTLGNRGHFCF